MELGLLTFDTQRCFVQSCQAEIRVGVLVFPDSHFSIDNRISEIAGFPLS